MSVNHFPVFAPRLWGPLAAASLLALAGTLLFAPVHRRDAAPAYRLHLNAPVEGHCYYGTAWSQGPVISERDPRQGESRYVQQFIFIDGCLWQATETLTPAADGTLRYQYNEHVLACRPGAVPAATCPRSGTVEVEPLASAAGVRFTPQRSTMPHVPRIRYHGCMELRSACTQNNEPLLGCDSTLL